ncbi:hypothetical protein HY750_01505 [Candidatus Kuenenbacteria bacterium]|nr:hypothetical protein [Candidatus Kuenenbacteria bacterium]
MFPKIFIIIPTFNEKENIEKLIKNIFALKIDNFRSYALLMCIWLILAKNEKLTKIQCSLSLAIF